jgi:hypothetical protein
LPDVAIKAAKFFLDMNKSLRICRRRSDFPLIADDTRITQQPCEFAPVVASDAVGIEAVESAALVLAFVEDHAPTETGLGAFENQELEPPVVIVDRNPHSSS